MDMLHKLIDTVYKLLRHTGHCTCFCMLLCSFHTLHLLEDHHTWNSLDRDTDPEYINIISFFLVNKRILTLQSTSTLAPQFALHLLEYVWLFTPQTGSYWWLQSFDPMFLHTPLKHIISNSAPHNCCCPYSHLWPSFSQGWSSSGLTLGQESVPAR